MGQNYFSLYFLCNFVIQTTLHPPLLPQYVLIIIIVTHFTFTLIIRKTMINFVIENDWKWNHCRLPIKRSQKHCKRRDEEYFYQVINSEDTGPINESKIKIALDRAFPFQADTGFVWHKSWNLPEIAVTIQQEQLCIFTEHYKEIRCQIMAVYPIKYSNSYYLHEIALQGSCMKVIHDNPIVFKFIKFAETSFNHNRNKFCLLIWIYGENHYKDRDDLFCLISSPIYVDSRKEARKDPQSSTAQVVHSPNKFVASIKGIKGSVSNSSDGFISYYSAQNIRNKIKHPFYVAYHFDRIFKIFLNNELKITVNQAISLIQNSKMGQASINSPDQNAILVQIMQQNDKNKKKILTILQKWKFYFIEYTFLTFLSNQAKWTPISKQQIKLAYKLHYQNELIKEENDAAKKDNGQLVEKMEEIGARENMRVLDNSESRERDKQRQKQRERDKDKNERQRNYELRTVIDLSRTRKKVKYQQL